MTTDPATQGTLLYTAKTRTIELPQPVLRGLALLDRALCRLSPSVFAMGRSIALRKDVPG